VRDYCSGFHTWDTRRLHRRRRLAAHYHRSPAQLSEEEVRTYLLGLRDRGVALGTFKTNHGAIQFREGFDQSPTP
jgi:hypothetical protein